MIIAGKERQLKGISISSGIVLAKACIFNEKQHVNIPTYKIKSSEKKKEIKRLNRAIDLASKQIGKLVNNVEKRIGIAESKIFVAQKMILEDESVHQEMFDVIETQNANAEAAVINILDSYESRLLEVDDEYIKTRATDIGEIKRRLLDILTDVSPQFLCNGLEYCQQGRGRIIVAKELTPNLTVSLETSNIVGFITEHGGKLSHAAILARALGIPAVSGIKNVQSIVTCGTEILVDGGKGEIIIWPDKKTVSNYTRKKIFISKETIIKKPVEGMQVMANINRLSDIGEAIKMKAEGIGLYRTEFEFLAQSKLLSEDKQYEIYSKAMELMNGKPIYFRLLDLGGDKSAKFLNLPKEENPSLGFRGSRLLLSRNDLFKDQVRALGRASNIGIIYILYPMIIDLKQFINLKEKFLDEIKNINTGIIKHGVMFEVPSACLDAHNIFKHIDFASIGTNDLIQYLFAVDRDNEYVAYDYNPERDVFWNFLKMIVDASKQLNKPLSVCGEIAGNKKYLKRLIDVGINSISVSARLIGELRKELMNK